jgi:hypothetical protein
MLSHEEMMRAPRGAVEIEVELQKRACEIVRWKNLRRITNPGDENAADVDALRPSRASLPMTEAQIPRKREWVDMKGLGSRFDDTFGASPEGETLHERLERFRAATRETEAQIIEAGEKLPAPNAAAPRGPKSDKAA